MIRLLSINVGLPRDVQWQGRTVNTAVWKSPVEGPRMVRRLNIESDGQADLAGHGGEHRAVFVYQIDSYRYWEKHLGRRDFVYGQFGENFTVDGLPDAEVCIGDRYRIGAALFEVTQPRVTCYRLGIRMGVPEMAALVVSHGRPGFYFRVLEEGEVQAGDDVAKVASGAEGMTVAEINSLLYKPPHPRDKLERALRIPELSTGWRRSFEALLSQSENEGASTGNAGLAGPSHPAPAWSGFRPLRVLRKVDEADSVTSLVLEPSDGQPITTFLPGQFVVLRLRPRSGPTILRSYSLSGEAGIDLYRVSVKREQHGLASNFIAENVNAGDLVEMSAPRGDFKLLPGEAPIVLLSAGIGATPLLAMLHALATETSTRRIWWIYGARNGREHPFAEEVDDLLSRLRNAHRHICYSAPDPGDRQGKDYDSAGRMDVAMLERLGLPLDADFYLCGPTGFMKDLATGLLGLGVEQRRVHTEVFGAGPSITPGIAASQQQRPHVPVGPAGSGPLVSFARTGLNVPWNATFTSLLEMAEACDIPVRWSCRTGVCHTCETGIVSGSVSYSPEPIDAPADGNLLLCCSRPVGDVVIDL
ncbi:MOSC and FAD-binding oxidoreductase domain-containing protein [Rhizobium leucaenae]|uniref:MOSC and FAD-binding oxidoreductase domain-containing protein n=1 Tax=Rhizobium leucaenae TaxID=29450 RepID=UPI0016191A24|nr:MOSC and FAD-binding oxidoreductase domain-containing protein [Rhizobium leucaenae]MBB6305479.1 ferredoxin-NADP reductase/MOSC domain-containing protein YiiM [Rhizobium leucaenae]